MRVYSFIAPQERRSFSGDVKRYFDYLRDNQGFPANNQYLLSKLIIPHVSRCELTGNHLSLSIRKRVLHWQRRYFYR